MKTQNFRYDGDEMDRNKVKRISDPIKGPKRRMSSNNFSDEIEKKKLSHIEMAQRELKSRAVNAVKDTHN